MTTMVKNLRSSRHGFSTMNVGMGLTLPLSQIALNTPGEWPKIAEFRVESRNDGGGTEIERWSVQKARV